MIDNNYMLFAHKLQAGAETCILTLRILLLNGKSVAGVGRGEGGQGISQCVLASCGCLRYNGASLQNGGLSLSMEELKRRILAEGKNLGRGILKVDSFINSARRRCPSYHERRFYDRRLGTVGSPVTGLHQQPHPERSDGGQPGGVRHHLQAPSDH